MNGDKTQFNWISLVVLSETSAETNNDVDVDIDIECGQDLACHPNDQIKLYKTLNFATDVMEKLQSDEFSFCSD